MALSEIEKLERRYAENPQGLTFAPLAEVHRKNGDVSRALELLRPGLTLHPDYIPASIVLGRCHLDLGELPASEAAFNHVLGLDAENVIALKALADIAERMLRFDDAERLLQSLLAVDRSNDEARDQLARVEAARHQAQAGSAVAAPAPDSAPVPVSGESSPQSVAAAALAVESPADELPADESRDRTTAEDLVPAEAAEPTAEVGLDWTTGFETTDPDVPGSLDVDAMASAGGADEEPPAGIQLEQPVTLEDEVEPIAGLVGREEDAADAAPMDLDDDFRVETAADIVLESSGSSEFQMANASEELLVERISSPPLEEALDLGSEPAEPEPPSPATAPEPVAEPEPAPQEPEPAMMVAEPAPAEPAPFEAATTHSREPEAAPSPPAPEPEPEPDLVITESMAELLLDQGYRSEALTVYRHLERRSPGDPRLLGKIGELEDVMPRPAPAEAEPPAPAWSVRVTGGRPAAAVLSAILTARPPAVATGPAVHTEAARASGAEREGAPTRPAHDSLSLSSVFGEESTPNAPAVPAAGSGATAQGGVSYDEFFGPAGAAPGGRPARAPDPKGDDLDQFHAWLQNLKR
jgi:tetratricopeptide (TPR) repeat protein